MFSISIHALVKRATDFFRARKKYYPISIHALVKRATRIIAVSYQAANISIHALVKRATSERTKFVLDLGFQSTPS